MLPTPDQSRRLYAKQTNEATKLSATALNALAVGLLIAGLVTPAFTERQIDAGWLLTVLGGSLTLHIGARFVASWLVSEE